MQNSSSMNMGQDHAFDSSHGIKEGSPLDNQLDKKTMKNPSHWIQGAHIKKGAFTAKANKAGMSVPAYAAKEKNSSNTKLARQATLAQTFERLAGKR